MNWPTEEEIYAIAEKKDAKTTALFAMRELMELIKAKNPEPELFWPDWANWIVLDKDKWYLCNQKPIEGRYSFYIPGKAEQIFNYDLEKYLEKLVWRKPWQECLIKKPESTENG